MAPGKAIAMSVILVSRAGLYKTYNSFVGKKQSSTILQAIQYDPLTTMTFPSLSRVIN